MNRVVIKRDGLEKNFDIACIEEAIKKAAIAADKEINDFDDIISKITNKLNKEKVTVEEIQDVIEHTLMVSKYKDVAKKSHLLMTRIILCVRLFTLMSLCCNVLTICVPMLRRCERLRSLCSL